MDQGIDASTPTPAAKAPLQSAEGSVKDTIESILVAFMLAFIFRAYVVEAFVIPTGSMAPTLLGAHMRFRCPDCGYHFDVNYPAAETADDVIIPRSAGKNKIYAIFCPNCGFRLPRNMADDPNNDATDPEVRYGDRILVLKYLYLFRDPRRWDVVVFKSPHDPGRFDYAQNYIKRLVGKPGETIMILDGDVYVGQGDNPQALNVQSKPRKVQEALWRIVYDNDYLPQGMDRSNLQDEYGNTFGNDPGWEQPWKQQAGDTGWTLGDPKSKRQFEFSNLNGASTIYFDADVNPKKYALTDWLAYDITDNQTPRDPADTYRRESYPISNNVSDVKLDFFYERRGGEGAARVQLTKLEHTIEAKITPNDVTLLVDGKETAPPRALPAGTGPIHVEVINTDYRASVWINGKEFLATTPEQYHPDIPRLLQALTQQRRLPKPEIRIIADKQVCALSHISLWRDVYYLNRDPRGGQPLRWASPYNAPTHLMRLKQDEFFVLGDNSFVSLDARYWDTPIDLPHEDLKVEDGRVPRRFMLGKAFFVYWPAGFRPIDSAPALAPNFGDMRFIH